MRFIYLFVKENMDYQMLFLRGMRLFNFSINTWKFERILQSWITNFTSNDDHDHDHEKNPSSFTITITITKKGFNHARTRSRVIVIVFVIVKSMIRHITNWKWRSWRPFLIIVFLLFLSSGLLWILCLQQSFEILHTYTKFMFTKYLTKKKNMEKLTQIQAHMLGAFLWTTKN